MTAYDFMILEKKRTKQGLEDNDLIKLNPQIINDKAFISNELLNAIFHQKATSTAIQLIMYIASRDEANTEIKGEYHHITIDIHEFIDKHKINRDTVLGHLKKIQETVITFFHDEKQQLRTMIPIISKAKELTRGVIRIDMNTEMYQRIKCNKNFSVLSASNFQNKLTYNTLRVLMLLGLINEQTLKRKRYDLEQLNYIFDTKYKRLVDFDRQIFAKAKAELDVNSNLTFTHEKMETLEIAKGRPKLIDIKIEVINKKYHQGQLGL